jgi:hypothetical protein
MFLGNYYPRVPEIEGCGINSRNGGPTYIGTGTADGKTTLQCIAKYAGNDATSGEFYGCVQDSCPAIGEQVTGHLKCQVLQTSPAGDCAPSCGPEGSPEACRACVTTACGPAIAALESAKCD